MGSKCSLGIREVWVVLNVRVHFIATVSQLLTNLDLDPQERPYLKMVSLALHFNYPPIIKSKVRYVVQLKEIKSIKYEWS